MSVITLIDADTWMGIYADDRLVYENHSIKTNDLLLLLNRAKVEYFGRFEASAEWMDSRTGLPVWLNEVKIAYMGKDLPIYEYIQQTEK
jgi:hypothetical protein